MRGYMKYFKNTELAKLYNVSEKSIRNWIDAAQAGKLELQLYEEKGKFFVANTSKNTSVIEEHAAKGKKFKNTRGFRTISPSTEFYETYTQEQILDVISNLTAYHEIPTVYTYADGGAKYWDDYAKRLVNEPTPSLLRGTIELLKDTADYVDRLLESYEKVNVVDLGPGNGLPVRSTLERLLKADKLNRYIAIDGSKEMLHILEQNIKEWFGGAMPFEGHVRDFSYERFHDLFTYDQVDTQGNMPVNLVFLLGSTLSNFRAPHTALQTINSSIGRNDLLLYAGYLDTPKTRRYFDYSSRPNEKYRSELILSFLGLDESLYTIQQTFDEKRRARQIGILPRIDLAIKFELANGERIVELHKDERILIWRHWHKNAVELIDQFDQNDFEIVQATKSPDEQYVLVTSKIKTGLDT